MPPIIDSFLSAIKNHGFVKSNRFMAFIHPNQYVSTRLGYTSPLSNITSRLALTCFSAAVQTPTFMTHDFNVTNPQRLIPYAMNTNNASGMGMEFYCLGDYFEKEFFHRWQRIIVDPMSREVAYYDDYTKGSKIDIVLLPNIVRDFETLADYMATSTDPKEFRLPGYTFTEVYPYMYSYNGGNVNYAPNTSSANVKVDFMFRDMHPFGWAPDAPPNEIANVGAFKPFTDKDTLKKVYTPDGAWKKLYNAEAAKAEWQQSQRDFTEYQRKLNTIDYEKKIVLEGYNQSRNIQRGVDGKLLNPKVDGLPAENPNDRIRSALFGALSFVQQAQGFGII